MVYTYSTEDIVAKSVAVVSGVQKLAIVSESVESYFGAMMVSEVSET